MTNQWHLRIRDTMMAEAAGRQAMQVLPRWAHTERSVLLRCHIHGRAIFALRDVFILVEECGQAPLALVDFTRQVLPRN
ncbi:hypothetical protein LCGC14_0709410 [marine sediment metagenome]|uniref:Uncharacterized protein n=1 Tax=marine sediment metagenome TaxID=412755 RepID=A0A0F9QK40_9ZZZZ